MAEIIEQGKFSVRHSLCGSLIKFRYKELKEGSDSDYLGDREYYRYIICPDCGQQIRFPAYGKLE